MKEDNEFLKDEMDKMEEENRDMRDKVHIEK